MAKKALAMMTSTEMLAGSAKYIAYAPWRKSSIAIMEAGEPWYKDCLLYTSPSPRDLSTSRMPSVVKIFCVSELIIKKGGYQITALKL